ncbi:hypothetical protein HW132_30855 [Brasilonema sp. CT11]|nr:hypothetical protein [Brasilonema sp. CT11]
MEERTLLVEITLDTYVCKISCPHLKVSVTTPFTQNLATDREKINYLLLALSRAVSEHFPPTVSTWN